MSLEKFGKYLIRTTKGKITSEHINDALMKQKFSDGYKKLGEILVEFGLLIKEELEEHLDNFHKERGD